MDMLDSRVLILNRFFMPVRMSTVRNSIIALTKGQAEVIDENYVSYSFNQWRDFHKQHADNVWIAEMYNGVVRSPSVSVFAPQVIRLLHSTYSRSVVPIVRYSRNNLYLRDENTCQYCFNERPEVAQILTTEPHNLKQHLNLDHVIPRSKGGKNVWENIVTSCVWCNAEKGDKSLKELGWSLQKQPVRPQWNKNVKSKSIIIQEKYWKRFLK